MDGVPDDASEFHRHDIRGHEYDLDLPKVRLGGDHETIAASLRQLAGGVFKLVQMSLHPFDLQLSRSEWLAAIG